jgi:outer membrane protein
MKNSTLAWNVLLAVAIAVLFWLHFSSVKKTTETSTTGVVTTTGASGQFRVAYFEHDSLENHYEYYKQVKAELQQLEQQKSNELSSLRNANIAKLKEYQDKGQGMTPAQQQAAQQDLMQRDKEYQRMEQLKSQEMQNEALQKLQDVKKTIEAYLKDYNKDKGYAFILSSSPDQNLMYYKDTLYNITNDLITGLNQMNRKK